MSLIKQAEAQLTGFAQASKGYTVESLADSMGLTKKEWIKVRDLVNLKDSDKDRLNHYFGL